MSIHFIVFLIINLYFVWWLVTLVRKKRRAQESTEKRPFIEVLEEVPEEELPAEIEPEDDEWLRRVRAEIEDMTQS